MTHLPQQIAPLKSWDEFEDLCCALFQKEWRNPMAQKNGRPGQRQNGVDVFGVNKDDAGLLYGVQCKGKDGTYGAKLTIAEITAELEKADTFQPKLGHWIIATTAPVDAKLQEYARKLTGVRKNAGLCSVTVYGWDDIVTLLHKHLDVTCRFYPSYFAPIAPRLPFHVPHHPSAYFSDPLNHLQTLRKQLLAQGETAVPAKANVQGMGGVGKTQLALKYSHDFRESYSGVWWFSAATQAGLESDCLLFCEKQGISVAQSETPGSVVRDWLAGQANWLLVYDNAEDVKMVRSFLPNSGKHHVLLTSRNPHWGDMPSLPLGVWDERQGVLVLRARLGDGFGNNVELQALSEALAGLPLALEQACAYILSRKVPVAKYIAALAHHATVPRLLSREDAAGCPRSVVAALSLAFEQLSPAAQELLKLCSWMAAEPIPVFLFTEQPDKLPLALQAAVQDEIVWRDTLAELEQYALCQIASVVLTDHVGNPGEEVECLSFHRLTQAAARVGRSGRETMLILDLPYGSEEPKNWPRCMALLPHVVYLSEHYQEQSDVAVHLGWLLEQLAIYFQYGPALYKTALPLYKRALALVEKAQGPEHPSTVTCLNNLAALYESTGDYAAALPLYQRALAIVEKAQGPEYPETGVFLNNLAELYRGTGDYAAALPLLQRALAIAEKTQGPEHPDTGTALNNLAGLYRATGGYAAALPLYQRALAIAAKAQGPEHPSTGISLNNLAALYESTGDYAAALPLFKRALAIAEKAQGPDHPSTLTSLNNLAGLHYEMGNFKQALPLLRAALPKMEKILGPEHPNTAILKKNLIKLTEVMSQAEQS